ncbi:nucleotide exchange factor GrpE [Hamadaea sp. NPDC051192]|uniref:nucleotide exchange factor GrpE n=1 Tax=Hamadaea sp. NPDC051192 TaxID=3154940 RepID=UPI00342CE6AC
MTQPTSDPLHAKLDHLLDLFQRRLLEDKTARQALAELTERGRRAEAGLFREALQPMVTQVARAIDRLDQYAGPDPAFAESLRDELLDVLSAQGVQEIGVADGFDPARHEAVETGADPDQPDRAITGHFRRGYHYHGWVFRPAQVRVNRPPAA